ncbi:MAG: Flp pilus assembly protein CpaB [Chloroflexota bacterium]|nr:Flp pilus assembly protein CpaB [Chloroflexota bacterium]
MKRSNRLVILVGVLLAVLAFVGVLFILNQQPTTSTPETIQATVLVASRDIAIDEEVTPDMVEAIQVDPGAVVGHPFADPSQLTGRPAVVDIPEGTQVNQEAVGQVLGVTCISCQLQPGEKAIAFQVDRVTGLDFLILPGDRIDVIVRQQVSVLQATADTINNPAGTQRFEVVAGLEGASTVKTVLQNKRVLYVSQAREVLGAEPTPPPEGGEAPPAAEISSVIIVFAGTDQDAELIKFAQNDVETVGPLTAVLRSRDDDVAEATTGLTLQLLIETYGVPIPNIVLLPLE